MDLRGAAAFANQTLQFTLAQSRASSGADRAAGAGLATCAFAQQESSQGAPAGRVLSRQTNRAPGAAERTKGIARAAAAGRGRLGEGERGQPEQLLAEHSRARRSASGLRARRAPCRR